MTVPWSVSRELSQTLLTLFIGTRTRVQQLSHACATHKGHQLSTEWGAYNYNHATVWAAVIEQETIMHLCYGWRAHEDHIAKDWAPAREHEDIVHLCQAWKTSDECVKTG